MKLYSDAHIAAQKADDAWSKALTVLFGKRAGDVRYTKTGQGEPGSALRTLYDHRMAAQQAWHDE